MVIRPVLDGIVLRLRATLCLISPVVLNTGMNGCRLGRQRIGRPHGAAPVQDFGEDGHEEESPWHDEDDENGDAHEKLTDVSLEPHLVFRGPPGARVPLLHQECHEAIEVLHLVEDQGAVFLYRAPNECF
jgi:hypothetical protein